MKGAKGAKGPFFGVVSIGDQRVSIYNSEGLVTRSVVSTGMAGHPTPKGVFTIIGRERYHHSNIYSGAPMPFMQRLTWSGVAMHLGVVPGYPASHGCIRLPGRFATELWGMTSIGERVVVSPRDVVPQEFAHALLPVPKMQPAPEPAIETGGVPPAELLTQVAASEPGPEMIGEPVAGAETKLFNPIAYAKLLKAKADADAKAAAKTVKQTFAAASAKTAEARRAVADVKAAEASQGRRGGEGRRGRQGSRGRSTGRSSGGRGREDQRRRRVLLGRAQARGGPRRRGRSDAGVVRGRAGLEAGEGRRRCRRGHG